MIGLDALLHRHSRDAPGLSLGHNVGDAKKSCQLAFLSSTACIAIFWYRYRRLDTI